MKKTITTFEDLVRLTDVGGKVIRADEVQSNRIFPQPVFGYFLTPLSLSSVRSQTFSELSDTSHEIDKKQRRRNIRSRLLGWGVLLGWTAIIAALASTNSRAFHILAFVAGWLALNTLVVTMLIGAKRLRNQRE